MSSKRTGWLVVALVSAALMAGWGVSWACDHHDQQAAECGKDKPGCAKTAEAAVANGEPEAVEAMAPAIKKEEVAAAAKADGAAPCSHAAGKEHPCAAKSGKPCSRTPVEAKAKQPAESGSSKSGGN